ncbi:hypothetical protein IHV09_22115 [Fictibacillus sp. 23RED33]|jgi:hypothetical protein|nr:hypothetical protein [Fictibacillus sp. 23RED33]MBH0176256.1 hypothetical protein [Fictibacillus sp. 23RED33]
MVNLVDALTIVTGAFIVVSLGLSIQTLKEDIKKENTDCNVNTYHSIKR